MSFKLNNLSTAEFAKFIGRRPHMFFGNEITITNLEYSLLGFDLNTNVESLPPFHYFNYWIKQKLNKFGSTYNWKVAILETYNNDEKLAFDKFYELLDEFLLLKPKSIITTFLSEDNFAFYYSKENTHKNRRIIGADNKYILQPAPYQIKLVEFDYCIHSYHYDYYFVVGESNKGKYYQEFDNLIKSKKIYFDMFGELEWQNSDNNNIENEFKLLIQ
ncbi:MAG TPA: hypothetical protein PK431_15260 [Chitinophagales bacterium]|nr:hypothetical protein [Chitinophagales bacterium]